MKNTFLILFVLMGFCFQLQAQNDAADFKKLLANFKEINAGDKIEEVTVLRSINTDH